MFGHALLPSGGGSVAGADATPPVKPDGAAPAGRVASMQPDAIVSSLKHAYLQSP